MNCYNCKQINENKQYCLWLNSKKNLPNIKICTECYVVHYFTKPYLFRKNHPEIVLDAQKL